MIFFVADLFVEQYEGGAELTTEAVLRGSYFPCNKVLSSDPKLLSLMKQHASSFWVFGNFDNMPEHCLLYAAKNLKYSVLEYDYKYCKYRSPGKHIAAEGTCNCQNERKGKIVSIFLNKAKATWWMSQKQLKHYQKLFPFLENDNNRVLSSVFTKNKLDYILSLDVRNKNNKYLILNSSSWIKGVEDAVKYAEENNLEYELVWGLKHEELLAKLAKSKGIIFFPKAGDTCPRMTIEARLLNCDLILNENVQHKDEPWFSNKESTLKYLQERTEIFWSTLESTFHETLSLPKTPSQFTIHNEDTRFNLIIPFYNCEKWISKCIDSIKRQEYKNFKCVLIDDMSTDNTVIKAQSAIAGDDRFTLIENREKKYALANIVDAIDGLKCDEEEVIILLDGDDWLSSRNVLGHLADIYDKKTLMTYGSYVYNRRWWSGTKGVEPSEYPSEVIKNNLFREDVWRASHLRTFKYAIWQRLNKRDLQMDGKYFEMTYDQAIMLPLLEMSAERAKYVPEVLHVYNKENPLNVDKIKAQKQAELAKYIRSKKRYKRIKL